MSNPYPGDTYNPYEEPAYQESAYQEPTYPPPHYAQPFQPPQYAQPYQQPWGGAYMVQPVIIVNRPTNGKAIASMVLGICLVLTMCTFFSVVIPIGFVAGLGTGIPAVVLGHIALKEIDRSNGQQGGRGMAIAGLVLGYITLGAALLSGLLFLFFFFAFFHPAS
ncbi:MAG TPA: DUF4190 domain-containing protein [Ktedonobacterales bacterium]|nr:DUF4190 domain-containing protein [Ktedonobacterales bacterium]